MALHIPWDKTDDWARLAAYAAEQGVSLGAINPNLFQENDYKLGSLCNPSAAVRRQAIDHVKECIDIAKTLSVPRASASGWPTAPITRAG